MKTIVFTFLLYTTNFVNNSGVDWSNNDREVYMKLRDRCISKNKYIELFEKARQNPDRSFHFNVTCRIKR